MTHEALPRACLLLWLVLLTACGGRGCTGCGAPYLAEAKETQGEVHRDFSGAEQQWQACEPGAGFRLGDGLRTGPASSVLLHMAPNGEVLVQASTTLRFERSSAENVRRFELMTGSVEVEADALDLEIASADSIMRVVPHSRVMISATEPNRSSLIVLAGRAVIERDGETHDIEVGHRVVLQIGEPLMETDAAPDEAGDHEGEDERVGEDEGEAAPAETPEEAAAHGSSGGPLAPGAPFDVGLRAGETATVHDAQPPTKVGFKFGCQQGGKVEIARARGPYQFAQGRGRSHATVQLPPGAYRYRIRCITDGALGRPELGGRVLVLADAATRKLPAKAQRVTIDADGRNYRIQYANRLPRFTFTWRDAPPASNYVLTVERQGGAALRRQVKEAKATLPEGTLGEGSHRYTFATGDARSTSKRTNLSVTFENHGGRTAYLSSVSDTGGATLKIHGGALAQSRVSVDGTDLTLDSQGRFQAELASPTSGPLVVRVTHPSTGVHYYVRRLN